MANLTNKDIDILESLVEMGSIYSPISHIANISKASESKVRKTIKKFERKRPSWVKSKKSNRGKGLVYAITTKGKNFFTNWEKSQAKKDPRKFYDPEIGLSEINRIWLNNLIKGGWSFTGRRGRGSEEFMDIEDVIKKAKETNMRIFLSGLDRDWSRYGLNARTNVSPRTIEKTLKKYR